MKDNNQFYQKIILFLLTLFFITPFVMLLIGENSNYVYNLWPFTNYLYGLIGLLLIVILFINNQLIIYKKIIRTFLFLVFIFLFIFISSIINKSPFFLYGSIYRHNGILMYLCYFVFLILGLLLKKKYQKYLFLELSIISIIIAGLTAFCNPNFSIISNPIMKNIFYNVNHLGYYLSITSILAIFLFLNEKSKIKYLYLVPYIINLTLLISNNTFGSYLGVLFSLLVLFVILIIKKAKIIYILLIYIPFLILSLIISYDSQSIVISNFKSTFYDTKKVFNSYQLNNNFKDQAIQKAGNRLELWTNGIELIKQKPILGYGIENYYREYQKIDIGDDEPHNSLIYIGLTSGVISIMLYLIFCFSIAIEFFKKIEKKDYIQIGSLIAFISYFVSSLFGNSMFYTTPYYFIIIGIVLSTLNNK